MPIVEDVAAGTIVIRQGDPADRFYLAESGSYRVSQTGEGETAERELRLLGAGDVFGEIGLLTGGPRTATVQAAESGRLWALDADAFAELVAAGPGLGSRLLDLYRGAGSRAA
jgi:CRP-like cAMP-binding protein